MKRFFNGKKQPSETFRLTILLSIVGGIIDTYTFMTRGQVLSNAQTGNIVYLAIYLSQDNLKEGIFYLFPILSFTFGILISELIRAILIRKNKNNEKLLYLQELGDRNNGSKKSLHWRQLGLFIEILILIVMGFVPCGNYDIYVNVIISFAVAIQYHTFKKSNNFTMPTTLCTGNLRDGLENICLYLITGNKEKLNIAYKFLGMIVAFFSGTLICAFFVNLLNVVKHSEKAIWCGLPFLIIVSIAMFKRKI